MYKPMKTTLIAGAVALILSGGALAAPPTGYNVGTNVANANPGAFDAWSATTGTVSISDLDTVTAGVQTCPAGWTCGTAMSASGFYQRQIKDGAGNKYFQTLVADAAGTGAPSALAFADESYVKIGATGLADKQHIADTKSTVAGSTQTDDVFVTDVTSGTGWANYNTGSVDSLVVSQSLTETFTPNTASPAVKYDAAYDSFALDCVGVLCATGKKLTVVQGVMTQAQIDGANYTTNANDDFEKFVFVRTSGTKNTAGHVLATPVLLPLSTTGTDMAWAAGDDVSAMWLGQQFAATGGSTDFGYANYAKWSGADTQSASISDFSNESTGIPFGPTSFQWFNATFGTAPTMAIPGLP